MQSRSRAGVVSWRLGDWPDVLTRASKPCRWRASSVERQMRSWYRREGSRGERERRRLRVGSRVRGGTSSSSSVMTWQSKAPVWGSLCPRMESG